MKIINPERQEELIRAVLEDYLSEGNINNAIILWENDFTKVQPLSKAIDGFLIKLSKNKTIALSVLRVRTRLTEALSDTQTPPAKTAHAEEKETSVQSSADSIRENSDPLMSVFSALLLNIVNQFESKSSNRDFPTKQVISTLKITDLEKNDIESFITGRSKQLSLVYPRNIIPVILISFYNSCSDELGTTKAGECMANAMKRTEKTNAAKIISPRSLL